MGMMPSRESETNMKKVAKGRLALDRQTVRALGLTELSSAKGGVGEVSKYKTCSGGDDCDSPLPP